MLQFDATEVYIQVPQRILQSSSENKYDLTSNNFLEFQTTIYILNGSC